MTRRTPDADQRYKPLLAPLSLTYPQCLETAGLLARRRDSDDERRVLLSLTPAGRALRTRAAAVPVTIGKSVGCDIEELTRLTASLHALRGDIEASFSHPA